MALLTVSPGLAEAGRVIRVNNTSTTTARIKAERHLAYSFIIYLPSWLSVTMKLKYKIISYQSGILGEPHGSPKKQN
jgi:hypothetical protein